MCRKKMAKVIFFEKALTSSTDAQAKCYATWCARWAAVAAKLFTSVELNKKKQINNGEYKIYNFI